jgi:cell division protein FtsA
MSQNIITGLDLGSGAIKIAVGSPDVNSGELKIIGVAEGYSEGISKGVITSIEDAVSSISACLERAERIVGVSIDRAFVGISGVHIISQETKGVVAVSRADGEIREDDVNRVLEAAQTIATPPNYEIIHIIPRYFTVDNQPSIKDPIGMTGVRLEVEAQIILGLSSQIKSLRKCLYRIGLTDEQLVFAPIACAEAVLNKRQKELGVALVNIGNTTTSFAVFEEGDILTAKVLPVGSRHITSDIAIGLRIPLDLAEAVKLNYGSGAPHLIKKHEQVSLKELNGQENIVVSRKEVAEIIEARCEEVFKLVDKELKNINRSAKLPAGVVLTGGGAKLPDIIEVAKKVFRLPVSLGTVSNIKAVVDKAFDPSFSTAVGLVIWGASVQPTKQTPISISKFSKFFKRIFKSIMP